MVDDVKDIIETAESKAAADAIDRARLARERREAEQRKRLDELRAHAAAAQAQREKRDEERRRRQAEQRAKDDDRRLQVEERKRAIWEASISRREALLQRERDRTERLERARAARSAPRPAFAFGSSTPRLLEPLDSAGFFWAARSTNPIDQMNFFESLAASTTNVMFASAPLVRRASALQLDSDTDNKDEPDRQQQPVMVWSSVARRRTDLVPTLPAPRAPGRAYSMTRLDKIPTQRPLHSASPSMHHLNRTQPASGDTTPGSRPGSALSSATGVLRRTQPRKPRPASIAGTGVNTPRGVLGEAGAGASGASAATTPSVSRDSTVVAADVPRRPHTTPRRPRPHSMHAQHKPALSVAPGDGKPPPHRKPKPPKELDKPSRGKSLSASPGRTLSPSPQTSKDHSVDKEIHKPSAPPDKSQVSAIEVTQKLEALQIQNGEQTAHNQNIDDKVNENKEIIEVKPSKPEQAAVDIKPEDKPVPVQKPVEKIEQNKEQPKVEMEEHKVEKETPKVEKETPKVEKETPKVEKETPKVEKETPKVEKETPKVEKETPKVEKETPKMEKKEDEKKESSLEKTDDSEMTASMTARRITTEEEAKAALAERRRRAREELERQAELERQRLQREAEEEAERQRQEEERQRREEEEARELAQLQRQHEEEKLRKAIEVQQQLERSEAERKVREEAERQARLKEDEERRRAAEEAERQRREEAEREEKERHARKQRVEAIMARTRLKKQQEEDKKQQEKAADQPATTQSEATQPPPDVTQLVQHEEGLGSQPADNGNAVATGDLLGFATSQPEVPQPAPESAVASSETNNGNVTADLLGLSEQNNTEDNIQEQLTPNKTQPIDNQTPTLEPNNGNHANVGHISANVGHISANFIQTERLNESQSKAEKLIEDDFTTHNGHGHNHPLTLQNAI